jgi:peptidyl-prolyl cis-trans isomerase A (cyclophilin A)
MCTPDDRHGTTRQDARRFATHPAAARALRPPEVAHARIARMKATLKTNHGDINLTLFPDHAPKTVRNFTGLADGSQEWTDSSGTKRQDNFYDGLTFHRIIPRFMIQGGCPEGSGTGGPGYTFDDEISPDLAFNKPYLLAMANAGKRMGKGTNGSQFFITVVPTPHLQGKHTIFGEVADQSSRDVVDAIVNTPTGSQDRPIEPVVIESVVIEND